MTDLDKLQGTWNIDSLEMDGQSMPVPGGACIVLKGDRFESLGMGAVYTGSVELDSSASPKQFDLIFESGPEAGNRSLGIYELDGDSWKICLTFTSNTRPTKFAAAPGSGHALEVLSRGVVAPAAEPASLPAGSPAPEVEGEWQMMACSAGGHPVPASMVRTGRRIARGGETTSYFGKQEILSAPYSVDKNVQPHAIDYALKDGRRQYGIWKFEGDSLHICFAQPGRERPLDFTAKPGQGHTFTAWRKTKD
jgi:uncharacterized protein (TIGR03067 family)